MTTSTPAARPDDRTAIGAGLGLYLAALAVYGAGGLALAWDGGWFVFRTAHLGLPTFLHGRVLGWVVQAPALLARPVVEDPVVLAAILGLCFVAVTAVALLACWRIVVPDRVDLLVFPALGLGLAGLPGQALALSESLMAVALAWPLVLAASLGRVGRHRWLVSVLVVAIGVAHPFAVPILVGLTGIVALRAWRHPDERRLAVMIVSWLTALVAVLVLRYTLLATGYEAEALSIDRLGSHFRGAIAGMPLMAVLIAIGVGAWLAWRPGDVRSGWAVALGGLGLASIGLAVWASDPTAWQRGLMFRTFAPIVQAPLWALAALAAGVLRGAASQTRPASRIVLARRVVPAVGLTMLAVSVLQTLAWHGLTDRLQAALAVRPAGCVPADDLPIEGTALDHWGLTSTVLVLEGRTPRHLVAIGLPCAALNAAEGVPTKIVDGVIVDRAPVDGWFDLRAIEPGGEAATP